MRKYPGILSVYPINTEDFLFYSLTEELPTLLVSNTEQES